jgi:hypothetical protein
VPDDRNVFDKSRTHQQVHDRTMLKIRHLRSIVDLQVHVRYECETRQQLAYDSDFRLFWNRMSTVDWNMNVRDSLYGGRVEALSLHCQLSDADLNAGYKIKYYDFVRLVWFWEGHIPIERSSMCSSLILIRSNTHLL